MARDPYDVLADASKYSELCSRLLYAMDARDAIERRMYAEPPGSPAGRKWHGALVQAQNRAKNLREQVRQHIKGGTA